MTGFETTQSTLNRSRPNGQSRSASFRALLEHLFLREKDPFYIVLILGVITFIGFTLRILLINKAIAYDEAYTFIQFASRPFKHILADYSAPNNHILHTILVGIAYRLFGGQAWVLRLPAFIAGILTVPAMYITARRFCSAPQALGASALIAVIPVFINYSVNGRGYTMVILFALLLTNFAGILVTRPSKSALIAFGLTGALGFYTIPIFLYPMAGVSLWVAATYLFASEPWQAKFRRLAIFLGVCILSGILTLLLYSPVILFGSGLSSLIGNEFVQSLDWPTFLANLDPRMVNAWNKWMIGLNPTIEYLFLGSFLLSFVFYRKISNQRLPLQLFLALAVAVLLFLQRVTPTPRIWLYLEAFYLMFAAAGLIWLVDWLIQSSKIAHPALLDRDLAPEQYAADYLADHLQPEDTIVATGPVDIETAYYLSLHGIPFDRFYKRDHPVPIQNALVMVRKNSKYETPESVLNFFKLDQALDPGAGELIFEYASVQIYSIPAK